MQPSPEADMKIIDDFAAVRLLINVYMIKKVKSSNRIMNQERFIDNIGKELRSRGYSFPRKQILYTWKHLLDNYQHYKKFVSYEEARKTWIYFDLMDNCFDDSKQTSSKFEDSQWTFLLIQSLNKYKTTVLHHGLTMDVLQAIEDDFQAAGNYSINQKDIYNQWVSLKRFYRQNQKTGYYKQLAKNHLYFTALEDFFQPESVKEVPLEYIASPQVIEDELIAAVESINDNQSKELKRQKTGHKINDFTVSSSEKFTLQNTSGSASFTIVMHDILLQCFKRNKRKIQRLNGKVDDDVLKEALDEFKKLGYNVTKDSISNEWNDLTCRYDLIKNTEHPEIWPYYSDMNYIYSTRDSDQVNPADDIDNQSTIGSIIVENVRKTQRLKSHEYAELTERLLNVYESNSKEFLEIKDILIERNLLREETNYLLNVCVEKYSKKKENTS